MAGKEKSRMAFASARGSGLSVKESAKLAGIGERSAYRLLKHAETANEVARVGEELDLLTYRTIIQLRERALDVLSKLLDSGSEATQLKAVHMILDHADRLHERIALMPKVYRLEDQLAEISLDQGAEFNARS